MSKKYKKEEMNFENDDVLLTAIVVLCVFMSISIIIIGSIPDIPWLSNLLKAISQKFIVY